MGFTSCTVVVPNPNGDIRVCVDMLQANSAIVRERHPIPTFKETLQELYKELPFFRSWIYDQATIKSNCTLHLDQSPHSQLRKVYTSIHD